MAKKEIIVIGQEPLANCDRFSGGEVENRIFTVRGEQVILDSDLAMLYGTVTKRFNEPVQRNINRFPTTFMFQLTTEEWASLRSQFATINGRGHHRKYLPYVFTEHGVIMAAAILRSEVADKASVTSAAADEKPGTHPPRRPQGGPAPASHPSRLPETLSVLPRWF